MKVHDTGSYPEAIFTSANGKVFINDAKMLGVFFSSVMKQPQPSHLTCSKQELKCDLKKKGIYEWM